ncbi:MAG: serine hydroxymethyltransferase [Candidatus Aenigmarchaeota archaeon]|nr:serine hydroxymethyltransferase [Candidatus Aenigmarchaeota archaeon]
MNSLAQTDQKINKLIQQEIKRQQNGLVMIASENYVSPAVRQALGSVLTNKYSEGYPNKRYYGGNQFIDQIELLAQERARQLFNAKQYHVNVQPYSGSPANLEVYFALLKPGDKIMGMALDQGGHLTHGHRVNLSGKMFRFIQYGVDKKTKRLNYQAIRQLAKREKPKLIISGATAYSRKINFRQFHQIAQEIDAISMADISHLAGLIVGQVHPSPFPFTDIVTTTTHKTLRGPRGAMIFCKQKFVKQIDRMVFPGMQGGPHNQTTAAIAVTLQEASRVIFRRYAQKIVINAQILAQTLKKEGIKLVTGGTDNHLLLVDLTNLSIDGQTATQLLSNIGIYVNKNMIPNDLGTPTKPSGIRLGTPALTTRGFRQQEMIIVGQLISQILHQPKNKQINQLARKQIKQLTKRFPLPR